MPVLTISGAPIGSISQVALNVVTSSPSIVSMQKSNIETYGALALNHAIDPQVEVRKAQAEAIDAYFGARNLPLEGMGMTMVLEAEKNDLDWRLLPAIAMRESTGGKFACQKATFSVFGWGSCKISFKSHEHGIETVARNLGGHNPNTARHYKDKNTEQILHAYNPPSIIPHYVKQVTAIMKEIGDPEIVENVTT